MNAGCRINASPKGLCNKGANGCKQFEQRFYTGMEGIPIITEIGVDVNVRLNPKINIGGRFEVESEFASFNFSNIYFYHN